MTLNYSEPVQRARQREAARRIASGELRVPLRCAYCESTFIDPRGATRDIRAHYVCAACGHSTYADTAHADRQRRIRQILIEGVDIPLFKRD